MLVDAKSVLDLIKNLQILADLEPKTNFPSLDTLKAYAEENLDNKLDTDDLSSLAEAFIETFKTLTMEWREGYTDMFDRLGDRLSGGAQVQITNAKVAIFNTLATNPQLCEMLNSKFEPNYLVHPHCLRQLSIDLAVENNNVPFLLLALKMLIENVASVNHQERWEPLRRGILTLAAKDNIDLTPITDFLKSRENMHLIGESTYFGKVYTLHWNHYEGELLNRIDQIKNKNEQTNNSYLGWAWKKMNNLSPWPGAKDVTTEFNNPEASPVSAPRSKL